MACDVKRLCNRLVISQAVTFANDELTINLPARAYNNCDRYCIVVAQTIPEETTIIAPVVITIGEEATTYPLVNYDGTSVYAASINTRTRYPVTVHTGIQDGVFMLTGKLPCSRCINNAASLPILTTPEAQSNTGGTDNG